MNTQRENKKSTRLTFRICTDTVRQTFQRFSPLDETTPLVEEAVEVTKKEKGDRLHRKIQISCFFYKNSFIKDVVKKQRQPQIPWFSLDLILTVLRSIEPWALGVFLFR